MNGRCSGGNRVLNTASSTVRSHPCVPCGCSSFSGVVEHWEDSFDVASLEAVYLTDYETGELLEDYTNPYTGETLSLPGQVMGPETQTFDRNGAADDLQDESALPGITIQRTHKLGPVTVSGDDVWLSVDSSAIVTRTSDSQPSRINDLETFNARLSDVLDVDQSSAPAQATLHLISSWQGWLQMGALPGSQVTRLVAKKAFDFNEIASPLQAFLHQRHPDIAADPIAALERTPESFER